MSNRHKLRFYRFLRRISAGCGWLLYFYEWIHVSYNTPGREQISFVFILVPSLFLIHAGIRIWIGHNKRLAAQGRRGLSTRYTSPVFSTDHLGRRLCLGDNSLLCKEIVVWIDGDSKFYAAAPEVSG
jgi:hypothetical protein